MSGEKEDRPAKWGRGPAGQPAANLFWGLDTDILPLPCAGQTPQIQARSRWHGCPIAAGRAADMASSTSLGRQVDLELDGRIRAYCRPLPGAFFALTLRYRQKQTQKKAMTLPCAILQLSIDTPFPCTCVPCCILHPPLSSLHSSCVSRFGTLNLPFFSFLSFHFFLFFFSLALIGSSVLAQNRQTVDVAAVTPGDLT